MATLDRGDRKDLIGTPVEGTYAPLTTVGSWAQDFFLWGVTLFIALFRVTLPFL